MPRVRYAVPFAAATAIALCLVAPVSAQTVTFEKETEPYPGLRILTRHTSGPAQRIRVAFVSLCNDGIHVQARSSQATRITSPTWGSAMGVQLAVNGDFYRTDISQPTVLGDAVGVGERWPALRTGRAAAYDDQWYYRRYGWIAFGDGWVELNHTKYVKNHADELGVTQGWYPQTLTNQIPPGTHALISGFPELVVEGRALKDFPDRGDTKYRHPRTAMGLSEDRSTFILAVVDGRRPGVAEGMTGAELAKLMKEMGAYTAFNLDGGGSSQMWLDKSGVLNNPSDGSPRPVANLWGIYAGTGHERGQEPGSCFVAGGCFPSPVPSAAGSRFADLPESGDDFAALATAVDEGLLGLCAEAPQPMVCPHCTMTRRDAVILAARAAELDLGAPPATPTFSDVPADAAGYAEIEAAAAAGWVGGYSDGNFKPDKPITRAQLAKVLVAARGWSAPAPESPSFSDVGADDALYAEVETLAAACGQVGCGGDAFCPDEALSRGDAASLALRAFGLGDGEACMSIGGDDHGGDGDGDGDGDGPSGGEPSQDLGGGCQSGGPAGAGAALAVALLLVMRRRRA